MRVTVLGGAGLTARCAVRALAESRDVDGGVVADLDGEAARRVSEELGNNKFEAARVDITDVDQTADLIRKSDMVINGVQYYYNLAAMNAALKAGANYLDFGGLYHTTLKQLKLDGQFRSKKLIAIVGMGGQPGITNVLARDAVDSLERVDSIQIRDGAVDLTKNRPPFLVSWSLDTFLDEMTMKAPVFENGRTILVPALSRKDTIQFPRPVGRLDTYVTIHSEVATLPSSFKEKGIRKVDWMEGVPGLESLRVLVDTGMASAEEITVGRTRIAPRKFLLGLLKQRHLIGYPEGLVPNDWEVTRVVVKGIRKGAKVTLVYDLRIPPRKEWGMSCAQYGVGIPASIATRMIGTGLVQEKGVLPAEMCIEPGHFLRELRRYGFTIKRSISEN